MPDTVRTLADLNALFADNGTGAIDAQVERDFIVSLMVHAEIGRGKVDPILDATLGTTYMKIPMLRSGVFERGFTADLANDQIAGTPVDMKVNVYVEAIVTSLPNNRTMDFSVFINGVEALNTERTFDGPGWHAWGLGIQLAAADTIDLRAKASNPGTAVSVGFVLLRAGRIGVE